MPDCDCYKTIQKIKDLLQTACTCGTSIQEPEVAPEPQQALAPEPQQAPAPEPQQAAAPEPVPTPAKPELKKLAMLFGLNYKGTSSELNGCINDVMNMKDLLLKQYNFGQIKVVTDNGKLHITEDNRSGAFTTKMKPTYDTMMMYFKWFVERSYEYDLLYFHYSGHGSYMVDNNGDEMDSRDECLVPLDYAKKGMIRDDDLKNIMMGLNPKCRVVMVMDACHSGTMVDLKYKVDCMSVNQTQNVIDAGAYMFQDWSYDFKLSQNQKYNDKINIMTISGCRDDQTSADAYINKTYQGALSYHFMKVLKDNKYQLKLKYLLKDMHCMLQQGEYDQKPVINSSNPIDIEAMFSL